MSMVKAYVAGLADGAKVPNILSDTELATCPRPGGHYYVFGRSTEDGECALTLSARVGGKLVAEDLPINWGSGGPKKPDDHIVTLDAAAGDTVLISLSQSAGTCTTYPSIRVEFVELTPAEIQQIVAMVRGGRRR